MSNHSDKMLERIGPLTTSETVKTAMLHDLGSLDFEFIEKVRFIRRKLLDIGNVSQERGYESILMQGSGTFGIESLISSAIPQNGHLLIIINGVYGERISSIASVHHIRQTRLVFDENQVPDLEVVESLLKENRDITHLAVIHYETTTGVINPIHEIGMLCKAYGITYMVDAMCSFGAVPIDILESHIDFLVSSSNKCIEGVPGFSFIISRKEHLLACEGNARSLTLDLFAQWKGLEKDGQFRFTPPTHSLLAFAQALVELDEEGGVHCRAERYKNNYQALASGMEQMGFRKYIATEYRGYIITCFHYPEQEGFDFNQFYLSLNEKGFVIYPGKLSKVSCFRIGNIGRIGTAEIEHLLEAIRVTLKEMHIDVPVI